MTSLTIILIVLAVIVFVIIAIYNKLVRLRTQAIEAWSDIDVQMKRRYDLIPNLVEAVQGYMTHERETLAQVTEMRARAMGATNPHDQAVAENMLSETLKSLFAVAENYPDLKANQNFMELQRELTDTENKIQASRRFYNANVRDLNIAIETFPSNIFAKMFSFTKREFFELAEDEQEAKSPVKVEFK